VRNIHWVGLVEATMDPILENLKLFAIIKSRLIVSFVTAPNEKSRPENRFQAPVQTFPLYITNSLPEESIRLGRSFQQRVWVCVCFFAGVHKSCVSIVKRLDILKHRVSDECRDSSRNVGSGTERHDSNHGKASIVQLTGSLLEEDIGINTRKIDWGKNHGWKRSSLGVVSASRLGNDFSEEDHANNLGLACM
jgi:hypothetical protein